LLIVQIYEPLRILPTKTCRHRAGAPARGQVAGYHYDAASRATLRVELAIKRAMEASLLRLPSGLSTVRLLRKSRKA
jgi:hypothetical protein